MEIRNRKKVCRAHGKCAIIVLVGFYIERGKVLFSLYAIVCTLRSFSVATGAAVVTSKLDLCLS